MRFHVNNKEVTLQGSSFPDNKVVNGRQMEHAAKMRKEVVLFHLFSLGTPQVPMVSSFIPVQVQQLLKKYNEVLAEPKGLPPKQMQDHKIPLLPGQGPVCVKPNGYSHYQKSEIEKLVAEMLSSGVIRSSNSPYSSLVLLVKKHDGSWRMCFDYRALNKITIKDKFPIPVIDELLDELHGAQFFLKLDLGS